MTPRRNVNHMMSDGNLLHKATQHMVGLRLLVPELTIGHTVLRPHPDNEDVTIAEYRTQGNGDQVFIEAEESFQNLLVAIRYAFVCMVPTGSFIVGKLGEVPPTSTASERHMVSGNIVRLQGSYTVHRPFEIGDDIIQALHNFSIFQVADLLERSSRTDMEQAIIKAIRLSAIASTEKDLSMKHLHLIQPLEAMFIRGRGPNNGISRAIRNGVCCVLETSDWKEIVQDQFELRSVGAHASDVEITEDDIILLSRAVTAVIHILLSRRTAFLTRQALKDWVESERYKYGLLDPGEVSQ